MLLIDGFQIHIHHHIYPGLNQTCHKIALEPQELTTAQKSFITIFSTAHVFIPHTLFTQGLYKYKLHMILQSVIRLANIKASPPQLCYDPFPC